MATGKVRGLFSGEKLQQIALAGYAMLARSLQQISSLVITLLAASFLLPSDYGIYTLGLIVQLAIQTIAYTGFYNFVIVSKEPEEILLPTAFWLLIGVSVALAVIASLVAYPLEWAMDAPGLGLVIILLVVVQPITAYTAWASAVLVRQQKVKLNFHLTFWHNLIATILSVAVMFWWQSLFALVAYRWIGTIVGVIFYYIWAARFPGFTFSSVMARGASKFASGLYGSKLLGLSSRFSSSFLVGFFYGPTEVGLYRFGNRIALGATDSVVQPMGTFADSQMGAEARGKGRYDRILPLFSGSMTLLTGMVGVGIIIFGEQAISLMFRAEYMAALLITYAMAMRGAAGIGRWLVGPVFTALGKTGTLATFKLVSAVSSIVFTFIAAPFGVEILAWTMAALTLVNTFSAFGLMKVYGQIPVAGTVRAYFGAMALSGVFAAVLWPLNHYVVRHMGLEPWPELIAGLICGGVLALITLYVGSLMKVFSLKVFSG